MDRGIAGVHAGILDMLGNCVSEDFTAIRNGVELDFLAAVHELADDHRMLLRHVGCQREEMPELLLIIADVHGSA